MVFFSVVLVTEEILILVQVLVLVWVVLVDIVDFFKILDLVLATSFSFRQNKFQFASSIQILSS